MGELTKIQWTDHTFNAWVGCHKISPACKNCYAAVETFTRVQRGRGLELWGADAERHVTSDGNWRQPLKWNRAAEKEGVRKRVFCSSLSDVFEKREGEVGAKLDAARARLWTLIEATKHLDWLLLTKRPENILDMVPEKWRDRFPNNVWLGATVEDQTHADERIWWLLQANAVVHFISMEPLLEPVDIRKYIALAPRIVCTCLRDKHPEDLRCRPGWVHCNAGLRCIRWVIVGGESGPSPRPFNTDWCQSIVEQCRLAGTACFVKQLGAHVIQGGERRKKRHPKGGDMHEFPHEIRVRQFPLEGYRP